MVGKSHGHPGIVGGGGTEAKKTSWGHHEGQRKV